jgi:hypothetical protein
MDGSDAPRRIVQSYSTMDTISGHVVITAPFNLRFENIDISFVGEYIHNLSARVDLATDNE